MNGVFGDLFDLDGDGSLDSTELGLDYAMADEMIEEEKRKEPEQEAGTEENEAEENGVEENEAKYGVQEVEKKSTAETLPTKGIDLKITLFSPDIDRDRLAETITENSKIKLLDAADIVASATELSLHCRTAAEARYMKQKIETTGAKVELPEGVEEIAVSRQQKPAATNIRKDIEETLAQPVILPRRSHAKKQGPTLGSALGWMLLCAFTKSISLAGKSSRKSRKR